MRREFRPRQSNRHAPGARHTGVLGVGLLLLMLAPSVQAQDTPEMLAAMRAALPPVPEEVPDWDDLPIEMRRQVPAFTIETHRWHADPAQRFVLIDGRRIEANGVAGRELWLREVRQDGVVMQFRDSFFFHPR